jgi:hypothetical protein
VVGHSLPSPEAFDIIFTKANVDSMKKSGEPYSKNNLKDIKIVYLTWSLEPNSETMAILL